MLSAKGKIFVLAGSVIGYIVTALFGGWTPALTTLIIFMSIDFISGLVVAGVFKKSPKTETGALESKASWKGLVRKVLTLSLVLIGYRLDLLIEANYIKNSICVAFIVSELISIIENMGLMGIPIPRVLIKSIDMLKQNEEEN